MGKTHAAKEKERAQRLASVPKKERLAKEAGIKRKEGRVLNAAEKHAVKMSGDYGTIMSAWENLRTIADEKGGGSGNTTARGDHSKKEEAVKQLLKLLLPQFETAARTPRMSRVIQSCLKHGTSNQLQQILVAMSKDFVAYCTDPYAHFIVIALLRHSSHELFRKALNLILSSMTALVSSKFGALVVHSAYCMKMCSATDRNVITLGVFKDSVAVMRQWKGYPILEDILEQETTHKTRLIKALFGLLDKLVSQKEAFGYPFVQRLLCAFFAHGGKDEIQELAISLKPHVGVFCDSKEGSVLASQVVSVLPPKQRKEALQSFKEAIGGEGVLGLCLAKHSAPLMARLFDLIYDGQILWKFVSGIISENISDILSSPYAHMVILHLLTPDQDRKTRALLPGYSKDYNLFSRGNPNWNRLTWLDADGKPETVEICSHPANQTHAIGIQQVVPAVVAFASNGGATSNGAVKSFDDDDDEVEGQKKKGGIKKGSDLFVSRIAKELVYLLDNDAEYSAYVKKAFTKQLDGRPATAEEAKAAEALIRSLAPRKVTREEMENRGAQEEEAEEVKPAPTPARNSVAARKSGRTSAAVSATPVAAAQTPRRDSAVSKGAATPIAVEASGRKSLQQSSGKKSTRLSAALPVEEEIDEGEGDEVPEVAPSPAQRRTSGRASSKKNFEASPVVGHVERSPRTSSVVKSPVAPPAPTPAVALPAEDEDARPSKKRRIETPTTGSGKSSTAPQPKMNKAQQLRMEALKKQKDQKNAAQGKRF